MLLIVCIVCEKKKKQFKDIESLVWKSNLYFVSPGCFWRNWSVLHFQLGLHDRNYWLRPKLTAWLVSLIFHFIISDYTINYDFTDYIINYDFRSCDLLRSHKIFSDPTRSDLTLYILHFTAGWSKGYLKGYSKGYIKGLKRPFWGHRRENPNQQLRSHQNGGRFATSRSPVPLFVPELLSFFKVASGRFPNAFLPGEPRNRPKLRFRS